MQGRSRVPHHPVGQGAHGTARTQQALASASGEKPIVMVVAAALITTRSPRPQVLLAQRPAGKSMAGLWEFPGGKVESGETPETALVREMREELGIVINEGSLTPLTFASHSYETFHLLMPVFQCIDSWSGTPVGAEGQEIGWVTANDLSRYAMPEADLPLLVDIKRAMLESAASSWNNWN